MTTIAVCPLLDRVLWGPGDMSYLPLLSRLPRHLLASGEHWWVKSKLAGWTFWIPDPREALIWFIARLVLSLKRITLYLSAGAIKLFATTFSSHFIGTQIKYTAVWGQRDRMGTCPRLLGRGGGAPNLRSGMGWVAESMWVCSQCPPVSWPLSSCIMSAPACPDDNLWHLSPWHLRC